RVVQDRDLNTLFDPAPPRGGARPPLDAPRDPYQAFESRRVDSAGGVSWTRYSPVKHASQKVRGSARTASCMPFSDRYPSESAVTYLAISSTVCVAPISSFRTGVSMP